MYLSYVFIIFEFMYLLFEFIYLIYVLNLNCLLLCTDVLFIIFEFMYLLFLNSCIYYFEKSCIY